MDWYYKAALVVAFIWGAGRALGVYGEASRDLDLNFLISFMLTLGGWAAVFLIIDRIAKFLGWKRAAGAPAADVAAPTAASPDVAVPGPTTSSAQRADRSQATRRTARRSRR